MKLSFEHISKLYGDTAALQQIDLTLGSGVYGLLGPNGAGKTTLMRIMTDLLAPSTGRVLLDGQDIAVMGAAFRKKLGYLPQDFGVYPNFTAEQFLLYIARLKGLSKFEAKRQTDGLLHMVGLEDKKQKKLKGFSGGQRQRVGIAQALLGDPEILVLDEPTAGLDPEERIRFRNILSEVSDKDVIIILSTHIVGDISSTCKKLALLNKGELKFEGSPDDMIELVRGKVWEIFVTDPELQQIKEKYPIISTIPSEGGWEIQIVTEKLEGFDGKAIIPNIEHAYVYFMDYLLKDKMEMYSEKIGGDLFN
mgnify:CR=1 FL=1